MAWKAALVYATCPLGTDATQTGAIYVPAAYPYLLAPIVCIVLFQFALMAFAGGLEEFFDPRLRA